MLTRKRINQLVDEAETPGDAIFELYGEVLGISNWDKVIRVSGFPKINKKTTDLVYDALLRKYKNNKAAVGMAWVDKGFSVDDSLKDGEADVSHVEVFYEQ